MNVIHLSVIQNIVVAIFEQIGSNIVIVIIISHSVLGFNGQI